MSQNGKGSKPRPLSVSYTEYSDRYDYIFRKKETKTKKKNESESKKEIKNDQSSN
jgi:hypothetical protein